MAKIGRNDPCYCGSGKKYKHCHMRADQVRELATSEPPAVQNSLSIKLWEFGTDRRFIPDFIAALEVFWNGRLSKDQVESMEEIHRLRFMDYFLHDHLSAASRERIIDLFAQESQDQLDAAEQRVLDTWRAAYLSVYRVIGRAPNGRVRLQDIFQKAEALARLDLPDAGPMPLLHGRLVTRSSPSYFVRGVAFSLSPETEDELKGFVELRYRAYQERHYGRKWPDFLRDSGYLVNHFIVEKLLPELAPQGVIETPASVDASAEAREIVRQMQAGIITGTLDQYYARWTETPVAAWGGKTPREMVQTDAGRERVIAVLDVLGEVERTKAASGQPAYDVNRLALRLGLVKPLYAGSGVLVG